MNYFKDNNNIVNKKQKGNLFVISGPSGSGKGTLISEIIKKDNNILLSVSDTTREKRDYETPGKEYNFIPLEQFEDNIFCGEYLEYAEVYKNTYYGTPKKHLLSMLESGLDVIIEIDVEGAKQIKNNKSIDATFIFILPPCYKTLEERLNNRHTESKESLIERLNKAKEEISNVNYFDYLIVNDNLESAISMLLSIINITKLKTDNYEINNDDDNSYQLKYK